MEAINQQIAQIEGKVQQLLERYHKVVAEKEALQQQLREAKASTQEQAQLIADLEEKVRTLQIARGATSDASDEKTALKLKINEYIREIDKCIAMLNT